MSVAMMTSLWLVLTACTDPAPAPVVEDPYDPALPEVTAPEAVATYTPEEVPQLILDALMQGFPSPFSMAGTFDGFLRAGDELCPGTQTYMADTTLVGCTSGSGWWYLGIGGYEIGEFELDGGNFLAFGSYGDMEILGPAGEQLAIGGHWIHRDDFLPGQVTWEGDISGSWFGTQTNLGWLDAGFSGWLSYAGQSYDDPEAGLDQAWVSGTMAVGDTDLAFTDLSFGGEGSESCEGNPTGIVRLRDPSGYWYNIDFGESCTGCGALSFGTQDLEQELCVDVRVLGSQIIEVGAP